MPEPCIISTPELETDTSEYLDVYALSHPGSQAFIWYQGNVTDTKDLYLYNQECLRAENVQQNWGRVVRGSVQDFEKFQIQDRDLQWFIRERSTETETTLIDPDEVLQLMTSGGRDLVAEVWSRLQERMSGSALRTVATTIHEVLQSSSSRDNNEIGVHFTFIDSANRLDTSGHRNAAMDLLYDQIDRIMRSGQLDLLDSLMKHANVSELSTDVLLGILTATLPVRRRLSSRPDFFLAVVEAIRSRGELEDGLLVGLD